MYIYIYKSIQNGKATGLDEIPVEVWKLYECQEFLLESCNKVYWQEPIERWLFTYLPKKRRSICHQKLQRYHINSYSSKNLQPDVTKQN